MNTEEETTSTETTPATEEEGIISTAKPILMGLAALALLMAIFTLLPMLFTYFSSGDVRAPSQIHPADPAGKSEQTIYKPLSTKK